MIRVKDFIHLPFTRDLTEGGIAYALRSLPYTYNRMGGSPYERLRRIVAGIAVELAFRRYLSEREIPFDVMGATPFTEPDRYDVALGGHRCDIKSFLITHREQIVEMKRSPDIVLNAPALVPSDQNAAEGHLNSDIYLFTFLLGLVTTGFDDLQKVIRNNQPYHLVHIMPDSWTRPMEWHPLGRLVLKSDAEVSQCLEIGGQDAGREMRSFEINLPPGAQVQFDERLFSLAYIHAKQKPAARIHIHGSARKETHTINGTDWGNIWVYGMDILLAGYLTREEFTRRATFLREGTRTFQYDRTRTKNLAVNVCDLKPLSDLLEQVE